MVIENQEFGGERPLYKSSDLRLNGVTIHIGESSLKECTNIQAENCLFEGKYVFWCCDGLKVSKSTFAQTARSSIWHSHNIDIADSLIEAPKYFREMSGIRLSNVNMPQAQETLWFCSDIVIDSFSASNADYIFLNCSDVQVTNFKLEGNYAFQRARNVVIRNSNLQTKDSFWESENITVYDSVINGEYLGWHSKNLRLVRCYIGGTQPLCYADGLVLEDCTFADDADLAFEYSELNASVLGHITSIKNPRTGSIKVDSCGELIIDENIKSPADCVISIGTTAE